MFLNSLSIDFATVKADLSPDPRSEEIAKFTNKDSTCKVLVTTYNLGATGLNMHAEYTSVVCLESPTNFSAFLQAVGRVHRLGQSTLQKVWFLVQDSTIQRWSEFNNTVKILPQIAAQRHDKFWIWQTLL